MAHEFDLVIRGGTVVSGDGSAPFAADVAVKDGIIQAVGEVIGKGEREIDAKGHLVMPGFVDVHTHYDGQVIWDDDLAPSSSNGVTTVVMGNCGVGFAPCRAGDREALVGLMEAVEDVPEVVMTSGLDWDWETFPEYLRAIESRPHTIDIGAQLPHSALRIYAMGERGANREPATEADLAVMKRLTEEAMEAGALGFATSRNIIHSTLEGDPIPSFDAAHRELEAIASGLKVSGGGVLQVVPDFVHIDDEFALFERMVNASGGRPLSYSLVQTPQDPEMWRYALDRTAEANAKGLPIRAQVIARPTGILMGLNLSYNSFSFYPSYQKIAHLPLEERMAIMRDPAFREQILSETPAKPALPVLSVLSSFHRFCELGNPPRYEPRRDEMISVRAEAAGKSPAEFAYDLLLENDGKTIFFAPMANYAHGDLGTALSMMKDPNTILGLGDGGAHYGMLCDSAYPTFMLTYWCRDRKGEKIAVETVVRQLTADPAEALGLSDRGRVAPGLKADLNVIDFDRLQLHAPDVLFDLPADGRRVIQRADGIKATIVSGEVIYRDGELTGARPGKLVRGAPQPAHA